MKQKQEETIGARVDRFITLMKAKANRIKAGEEPVPSRADLEKMIGMCLAVIGAAQPVNSKKEE